MMIYDSSFDQLRLNMLAEQYLKGSVIEGSVIFSGEPHQDYIDHATPKFTDADYTFLKDAGFMLDLIELLHILSNYRGEYTLPNSRQGVVCVSDGALSIEWLSLESIEALRAAE